MNKTIFAILLFLVAQFSLSAQTMTARLILDDMYAAFSKLKRYSYEMSSKERFGSKYLEKEMLFKINESPKKVYAKDKIEGVEIMYVQGWNNNKVYINPNGFPWTNLSFEVSSSRVREESHHLLTTAGFAFTEKLLRRTEQEIKTNNRKLEEFFTYMGDTEFDGRPCYKLFMEYKDYRWKNHTVAKDQDLAALCMELGVPEFAVKERNNLDYGKVRAGKTIQVPSAYAKKVVFFISKQSKLPLVQLLYDDKDLYEKYEYRNMQINPSFPADEFTENCSSYGF